jgi:hypothetical protein
MASYNCEKCNFVTENKKDFSRHIKTKKHQRNMGEIEVEKNNTKTTIIQHKTTQENVLYECDYCDSCFKHVQSKYRHQKYFCKAKRTQEQMIEQLEEKHKQELEKRDKTIQNLLNKLDDAIKRIGTTNNNTTNNNNINNSRNLNITINAYGQEDISYLKDGDWLKMLTKPQDSIVNLFLETHFNPEHPENSNIRLRNRNSKFLEVHDGDNWKNKKKKKMLSDIADDKQGILDDRYAKDEELQNEMTERQRSGHAYFHDEMYYNNKKEIMDEMEGVLLDNK